MKKITITLLTIFLFINFVKIYSQNSSGLVVYTASLWKNEKINTDTLTTKPEVQQTLNSLLKNKAKLDYKLIFNNKQSKFEIIKQLENKENILLKVYVGKEIFFYDREQDKCLSSKNTYGDDYLIYYPKNQWNLTNDKKEINGYLCSKATTKVKNYRTQKERTVIAWFTSEIPINYGPANFSNLPGLILELEYEGKYILKAKKIQLNMKEEVQIDLPKRGIKITLEQYEQKLNKLFKNRFKK